MGHENAKKNKRSDAYLLFKPYVTRLLTYIILLYLSWNNYQLYTHNEHIYDEYLKQIGKDLVSDAKLVPLNTGCDDGYKEIQTPTFKKTSKGCACDGQILKESQCQLFFNYRNNSLPNCKPEDYVYNDNSAARLLSSDPHAASTADAIHVSEFIEAVDNCQKCYNNITGLEEDFNITYYYEKEKICMHTAKWSTYDYLKSMADDCAPEDVCNMYFCRKNHPEKKCPLVFINTDTDMKQKGYSNYTKRLYFSSDYSTYDDYDANNHPYIYLPVESISLNTNGVCMDDNNLYDVTYPLADLKPCVKSIKYTPIEKRKLDNLLSRNNALNTVLSSLPLFLNYTNNTENSWDLNLKTSMQREIVYCFVIKKNLFLDNRFTINSTDPAYLQNRQDRKEAFIDLFYAFLNLQKIKDFLSFTQKFIMLLTLAITAFEVVYVLYKMLNLAGDNCKSLLFLLSYEGYFAFTADVLLLIICIICTATIKSYLHHLEEFIHVDCLDSLVKGKFEVLAITCETVADKSLEMTIIILVKMILILIAFIYNCIIKKGRMSYRQIELIIFEKEEEEEHDEHGEEHSPAKKKRIRLAQQ